MRYSFLLTIGCFLSIGMGVSRADGFSVKQAVPAPRWSLYAVEYARSAALRESRLVRGVPFPARVDMSWYFFVAVGHGRVVLIDCGTDALVHPFREGLRGRWSIDRAISVTRALARVGLTPAEITDVVLTHSHWDHVGGLAVLPNARVHTLVGIWQQVAKRLRGAVEAERRLRALRAAELERPSDGAMLRFASFEVASGMRAFAAGGHTRRQLMVEVPCEQGARIIVGDAAYLYRTIDQGLPVAVAYDASRNRRDLAALIEAVGAGRLLPGHDPEIFRRYVAPIEGVAAICQPPSAS